MRESASEQEFRPGEVVEGFRIEALLGPGGMSSVYRAEDLANKRTVALKLPAGGSSASEQALLRFRREARLAASIAHPNCVLVYGALELRGSPAIAMEWVPGGTLQERTAAGTIPIEQAVEWTMQVIDGLEAAWSAGILHRDVKPANCFVGADGEAKVGDFGLSKSFEQPSDLTVSGAFLGTPLYASPEQVRGRELDHRTDIYSVGATLYTLLVGRPPFTGAQQGEVMARILSEPVPFLRADRPEVPRRLERVVVKAMAKDPKERYETYAEFRAALLPFGPRIEVPGNPAFRLAAWLVDSLLLSPIYLVWWLLSAAGVEGAHFEDGFPANTLLWNSYSFLLWLLYYSLLERGGRASLGKRLFALRVKASDGTDPPLGRVFLRSALYMAAFIQSDADPFWWLLPLLTATIVLPSSFRKTGFRGIHELLSKTRVVRSHPRQRRITQGVRTRATRITDAPMELAGAMKLLRRIPFPGVGEFLEGYEPELERRVLVHRLPADVPLFPAEVRQPSGLKLLRQIKAASGTYHVYEAIGGEPLRERLARGPFERWEDGCELVSDLIRVCQAARRPPFLDELWLDDGGKLRVLNVATGKDEGGPPVERLIAEVAALALLGERSTRALPLDLPLHAEPVVRSLLQGSQASLEVLDREIGSLIGDEKRVNRGRRCLVMLMTSIPVLFLAYLVVQAGFTRIRVSSLLAGIIIESQASRELERRAHTEPLYYTDNAIREAQSIAARVETMRLISSLLSHSVDEEVIAVIEGFEETESVTGNLIKKEASELSETRAIEVDIRALRAHFALHDRDKNRALWMLRQDDVESFLDEFSENGYEWKVVATEEWTGPTPLAPSSRSLIVAIVLLEVILLSFLFLGTLDVLLALALRGIPVFLLVGLGLRQMNGRRASRWRCFIRTLLVWMPVPLLLGAIDLKWGWRTPEQLTLAALALGLLPLAHLLTTLLDPRSGLIDKLVGTRVVLS